MKALIGSILLLAVGPARSAPAANEPQPAAPVPPKPVDERAAQVIRIAADDTLLLNGAQVTRQELLDKLRAAVAKDRNVKVVVHGDKQVKYRTVAEILGLFQLADLWNIHLASGKE